MKKVRDTYGNSAASGYTIDFFTLNAPGASQAFLASPFFSTFEPIGALTVRGCKVRLLVRLCSITLPTVLRQAFNDPHVAVRYYTSRSFHAKLYIIDDVALVGSANLTDAGLKTNREVSVVLRKGRDTGFDALPAMFNLFWDYADVLDEEICARYEQAFKMIGKAKEEQEFQDFLEKLVPAGRAAQCQGWQRDRFEKAIISSGIAPKI
ncbi:PLD-like domain-containing protein [Sphingomonas sp. YR710]|uniref:phospholipase D family protein n=1 Tax=Sphingomonas sp. YR710 TaxID=1882773 RepID=UPI00088A8A7A|nr:phospholipase D family protein [Sphingomonas sp. YR710]SDC54008.1 PLD-like domain-containing protein [Sphingomonas sp. YR710]